jgi:plastocyanin
MKKAFLKYPLQSIWTKIALISLIAYPLGVLAQSKTEHVISQKNRTYAPGAIEINVGDTVKVVNDDIFLHHAFIESDDLEFDSGSMEEMESASVRFKKPGTYNMKCAIHPKMNLEITVK